MSAEKDNRSASQKISDMENALMSLYQAFDAMSKDLGIAKDAIKLLGNKLDSVVKATTRGEALTDEVLSRIMIENNCEELAEKVKLLVAKGNLTVTEQVAIDSFLVGSELDDEGKVLNPRLQFALFAIKPQDIQEKFLGAKVGDLITIAEGRPKYKVQEIYQIQPDKPEEEPATEAPATETTTAEAPAEVQAAPTAETPAAEAPAPEQSPAV
jgi:hypothetical protein